MGRLETVRHELLALHRALLTAQRVAHEREHGKLTSSAFLELVIGAPEFAWLRPLTALIVGIDEAIDLANPGSARARRLALIAAKKAAVAGAVAEDARASTTEEPTDQPGVTTTSSLAQASGASADDSPEAIEALLLVDTRKLLTPDAEAGEFQQRYATAMHDSPEIVIAHASVLRALSVSSSIPS